MAARYGDENAKRILRQPEGAPDLHKVISLWRDMSLGRHSGARGAAPLSWADASEYGRTMGRQPPRHFLRAVLVCDRAYLAEIFA
ncbi:phage tail assembly chaperone [Oceanicaulis sp.]|uniref:phage tail assembly chaperone n=1 Tax=Oceanicaulis sp. TaxID=1924941 RepID=UPI003F71C5C9